MDFINYLQWSCKLFLSMPEKVSCQRGFLHLLLPGTYLLCLHYKGDWSATEMSLSRCHRLPYSPSVPFRRDILNWRKGRPETNKTTLFFLPLFRIPSLTTCNTFWILCNRRYNRSLSKTSLPCVSKGYFFFLSCGAHSCSSLSPSNAGPGGTSVQASPRLLWDSQEILSYKEREGEKEGGRGEGRKGRESENTHCAFGKLFYLLSSPLCLKVPNDRPILRGFWQVAGKFSGPLVVRSLNVKKVLDIVVWAV